MGFALISRIGKLVRGLRPHPCGGLFVYKKHMQQKFKELLDDLQDDTGSITLTRGEFEALVTKYGTEDHQSEEYKKWGKVITGALFYSIVINFLILAILKDEKAGFYFLLALPLGFLASYLLRKL